MDFNFDLEGADQLKAALRKASTVQIGPSLAKGGQVILTQVRANASGRPGPNVVTNQYRGSWSLRRSGDVVSIGTNAVQGLRLENGFVGTDSLGRTYNQPPYPHAGPAVASHGQAAVEIVFTDYTSRIT